MRIFNPQWTPSPQDGYEKVPMLCDRRTAAVNGLLWLAGQCWCQMSSMLNRGRSLMIFFKLLSLLDALYLSCFGTAWLRVSRLPIEKKKIDRVCIISSMLSFFGACRFRKFEVVLLVVSLRSKYWREDIFLPMQSGGEREVCLCTQVNTDYSYFLLAMYRQRFDRQSNSWDRLIEMRIWLPPTQLKIRITKIDVVGTVVLNFFEREHRRARRWLDTFFYIAFD